METTFLMLKPDAVKRKMIGRLVQRFEDKGYELIGAKLVHLSKEQAETHYAEHAAKPFYGELVDFITSGPVFAMVWQGEQVIAMSRAMMGKTNPLEAAPGTIRGDFAIEKGYNVIHGSDSSESAAREIANVFAAGELLVNPGGADQGAARLHINANGEIQ
jgi:nucleoside-diphosphate kinase